MFVTEIALDRIRGRLGSYLMTFINAGCLLCYIIGSYLSYTAVASICLAVPVLYSSIFAWMPETPVFLYRNNKRQAAERSMLWYRGGDVVQTELEMSRLEERVMKKRVKFNSLWANKGTIKGMLIGFGFVLGQQLCGILAILTYTVMIFKASGSTLPAHLCTIIVGTLQVMSSLTSSMLVDKAGRRVLLLASYLSMSISLAVLGWYFLKKDELDHSISWIPVTCLSIHVIAYSIGAGPVPFIVMSEIFSPDVRGMATSVIQFLSTSLSFATVKTFPLLTTLLGTHGCFWFYGIWCVVLSCFTLFCIPETKGKTLNSILNKLNGEPDESAEQEMFNVGNNIKISSKA
jgi:MFS family permease